MKLTINTQVLQRLVSKAVRGVSNNKMIPITCMIGIKSFKTGFSLTTTDASNYLYVEDEVATDEDFEVTVYADVFAKLISRMTCDNITLELKENYLEVVGNGTYKVELPFDENGKPIKFPMPISEHAVYEDVTQIQRSTIEVVINSVKPALATTLENPQYTAYWVGDSVIATDSYKISAYKVPVFDTPVLISAEAMELLSLMESETVDVSKVGDYLIFSDANTIVYTKPVAGLTDYSIDAIKGLIDMEFDSSCEVSQTVLLQLLDRLSLFVKPFDDGNINLTFTKTGLVVTSMADSGSELIPYMTTDNFKEFHCSIDINLLQTQVKSNMSEAVKISFGKDSCIKIADGTITKVIALNE